jgi:hypothetical protein
MSDTQAIDAVIAAFFAAFDNRGGRVPDMDALRALFVGGGVPRGVVVKRAGDAVEVMDVEAFIAPRAALLTGGRLTDFHEWETEGRTEIAGGLATRWSRYAKSGRMDGAPTDGTGLKTIALARTPDSWRLASVVWEDDAA